MIKGGVQRALRAKVALMDRLGDCMRNLVGFVGKPVLDARGLGRATGLHERDDVAARNVVSCLLDVNEPIFGRYFERMCSIHGCFRCNGTLVLRRIGRLEIEGDVILASIRQM